MIPFQSAAKGNATLIEVKSGQLEFCKPTGLIMLQRWLKPFSPASFAKARSQGQLAAAALPKLILPVWNSTGYVFEMIQILAHRCRFSAFVFALAYALIFGAVISSFAQAAAVDRTLNGGAIICTNNGPVGGSEDASGVHCQMCCLCQLDSVGPVELEIFLRLSGKSDPIFLFEGNRFSGPAAKFANPRGPPVS